MLPKRTPAIRAWLGGSFDPVHEGHLAIMRHLYHTLVGLSNLPVYGYFLPTAGSPLKQRPTPALTRLAMLQQAVNGLDLPNITIDTTELEQNPPVYTFNTLQQFSQRYPEDIRIFVMGEDSVLDLARWYQGVALLRFAHLWVIPRSRLNRLSLAERQQLCQQLLPQLQNKVTFSPLKLCDDLINPYQHLIYIDDFVPPAISSSQIRAAAATGQPLRGVPNLVQQLIDQQQLYR